MIAHAVDRTTGEVVHGQIAGTLDVRPDEDWETYGGLKCGTCERRVSDAAP